MSSLDVVSKTNIAEVDNAANERQPDTVRRDEPIYAEAKSHYSL